MQGELRAQLAQGTEFETSGAALRRPSCFGKGCQDKRKETIAQMHANLAQPRHAYMHTSRAHRGVAWLKIKLAKQRPQ